jgi:hypothetical protein
VFFTLQSHVLVNTVTPRNMSYKNHYY